MLNSNTATKAKTEISVSLTLSKSNYIKIILLIPISYNCLPIKK